LGAGVPAPELTSRVLTGIGTRRLTGGHRGWVVGFAVAAVLFTIITASTLAVRSPHSAPRAARPTPSLPLMAGAPSGNARAGGGPAPTPSPSTDANHSSSPGPGADRNCTSTDIVLTTKADASHYAYGEAVDLATMARNVASTPCAVRIDCISGVMIYDSSGNPVILHGTTDPKPACAEPSPQLLDPGASTTLDMSWNQRGCANGTPCPTTTHMAPGTYTARGRWGYQNSTCTSPEPCMPSYLYDASAVTFTIDWPAQCRDDSSMRATVSTDRSSYAVGAAVTIKGTLTNASGQACWFYTGGSGNNATPQFTVADNSTGSTVWGSCSSPNACNSPLARFITDPGQSYSWAATWNQQQCNSSGSVCSPAAPGTYTAYVWFPGAFTDGQTAFTIGTA